VIKNLIKMESIKKYW